VDLNNTVNSSFQQILYHFSSAIRHQLRLFIWSSYVQYDSTLDI